MRKTSICIAICSMLTLVSFKKEKAQELLPGFKMVEAPNDLDKPGTIFRVTKQGERYEVGSIGVEPTKGKIEVGKLNQTRSMSAGILLDFLKIGENLTFANGKLGGKNTVEIDIKLADAEKYSLSDMSIDDKIISAKTIINANRKAMGRMDDRYYIIREVVYAKNFDYTIKKGTAADLGVSVDAQKVVSGSVKADIDKKKNITLSFNYPAPLCVFYKVEELSILHSVTGEDDIKRTPIKANDAFYNTAIIRR